ncbi:hypothetical protein ACFVIM_14055 [Streptomyces sp. NPDC057638]|uniref:hypothetical protein n=1 Tax=Streptomyces sp. NPDC057638 TaxID=3346190 RepID=UPI0036CFB162
MTRTSRGARAAGAWGHLLLITVLALGVFAMHTTGHPDDGSGMDHTTSAAPASPGAPPTAPGHGSDGPAGAPDPSPRETTTPHDEGMAMDMSSLCVAVLSGWVLAVALHSALNRRADWLVRLRAAALAVARPQPPPPRAPDLHRLSILRT